MERLKNVGVILFVLLIIMGAISACGGGGGDDDDDNALPVVVSGSDQIADEGDILNFSGSFSDADTGDTHTWEWDFGEGNADATTLTPSHTYADDGVYTVTLTVTDSSGGVGEDSLTVTVANLAPTVDAGENQTVTEGDLVSFAPSVSDPGAADTFTYAWDFGDGSAVSTSEAPTHVYGTADEYTVTLTVEDDDGASNMDTLTVTVQPVEIDLGSVLPLYSNAPNWNDYVNNDGSVASTTGTGGYFSIIHGGEMRAVAVYGMTSCDGITAEDNLGAFKWTCQEGTDPATDPARVVSAVSAEGFSLSDLIDFGIPNWRGNHVTVYKDAAVYGTSSLAQIWWDNPVEAINDPAVALTSQGDIGTIYAVAESLDGTLEIASHKVALVTDADAGVRIHGNAAAEDVVQASGVSFLWIEADMMGASGSTQSGDILSLTGVQYSVLRNMSASGSGTGSGVYLNSSHNNLIADVGAFSNYDRGIQLENSGGNRLYTCRISNNYFGLDISIGSNGNILNNVISYNNINRGVRLAYDSINNVLVNITVANNGYGFQFYVADYNVLYNITATNNWQSGVVIQGSLFNKTCNMVGVNNGKGVRLYELADSNVFNNVGVGHDDLGILIEDSSYNKFTGLLKVGNNSAMDCSVVGSSTNPGLDSITCENSQADLLTGVFFGDSFKAEVTSNDAVNDSDNEGSVIYEDIEDWIHFENYLRAWGKDGANDFPDWSNRSSASSGDFLIWDWSLNAEDSEKALLGVLNISDPAATLKHTWSDASTIEFLQSAFEIMADGVGNDNGLCEAGEGCVFTPNIGSYQGHGELVLLDPQPAAGYTLYRYEINGR